MRRLTLSGLSILALASLLACSDVDDPTDHAPNPDVCEPTGTANIQATCGFDHVQDDANARAAAAFHEHAVLSSSAAGGAARFVSGILVGAMECFARAMVNAFALAGAPSTPVDCSDVIDQSAKGTFANGTYTVEARQRGGSPNMPWTMNTNAKASLQVFLARDAGSLKKGDLVTVDVQNPDSFLVNARLVDDGNGNTAIAYDRVGPLSPLLGIEASSPNPAPMTKEMRDGLSSAFEVEGAVHVELSDCNEDYRSVMDHTIPRTPTSQALRPTLVRAETKGKDGALVVATEWDATYAREAAPRGHITADVTGPGKVRTLSISLDDPDDIYGSLSLDCTP